MRMFLSCGFMIFWSLPLMAALPEEIETLIQKEQYEKAIALLEPLAAKGNNEAQNKLGEIYQLGHPDYIDYSKARELYLKAVNGGNGDAANHLGRIYTNGEGVKPDEAKATYWYKKGMELGDVYAERNYYHSIRNPFYYVLDKAIAYDPEACFVVAQFYQNGGIGIVKDKKKANEYRKKAAQLGYKSNIENLTK